MTGQSALFTECYAGLQRQNAVTAYWINKQLLRRDDVLHWLEVEWLQTGHLNLCRQRRAENGLTSGCSGHPQMSVISKSNWSWRQQSELWCSFRYHPTDWRVCSHLNKGGSQAVAGSAVWTNCLCPHWMCTLCTLLFGIYMYAQFWFRPRIVAFVVRSISMINTATIKSYSYATPIKINTHYNAVEWSNPPCLYQYNISQILHGHLDTITPVTRCWIRNMNIADNMWFLNDKFLLIMTASTIMALCNRDVTVEMKWIGL